MPHSFEEIPTLAVWEPIHRSDWDSSEARHFLERAGFAATRPQLEEALDLGAAGSVERFFAPAPLTTPEWIEENLNRYRQLAVDAKEEKDREQRRKLYQERNQVGRETLAEFEYEWLRRAANPDFAFRAKWELFLSDVWVVGKQTVGSPQWMHSYWKALAEKSDSPYPLFCKDFSREPAMVRYLDLNRSSKTSPNENFARELLELFALGEGNYTEDDIKESARAFTGRRLSWDEYREEAGLFDNGEKTVFGQRGNWDGDEVIDIIFQQPSARTFLPSEALRFYLTRSTIPPDRIKLLGDLWREEEFSLAALRQRLFTSRAFYAADFRGNRIKSPIEFYLGTLHRFALDPVPVPAFSTRRLRDMGQELLEPPNVRGWIGGEAWINAGKLAARRQVAAEIFEPLPERRLNADDQLRIDREKERGSDHFRIDRNDLLARTGRSPGLIVRFIEEDLLATPLNPVTRKHIRDYLGPNPGSQKIMTTVITVLQSPQYQLS